jgi:hypothetical protein
MKNERESRSKGVVTQKAEKTRGEVGNNLHLRITHDLLARSGSAL